MSRTLTSTRYLILIPILGLVLAASTFLVLGGIDLIRLLIHLIISAVESLVGSEVAATDRGLVIFEVVEYVHLFLVCTVLYITAVGLYQLFVHEVKFPNWLQIDSTEELETNLLGVTVVVLAVNFMGAVFVGPQEYLLEYGAGIALPIAALGLFVGLRAWSVKLNKEADRIPEERASDASAVAGDREPWPRGPLGCGMASQALENDLA